MLTSYSAALTSRKSDPFEFASSEVISTTGSFSWFQSCKIFGNNCKATFLHSFLRGLKFNLIQISTFHQVIDILPALGFLTPFCRK
jgi:hypothetical protein